MLQRLMEFEVESLTGAARHERSESRITQRNGYRERALDTRLGALDVRIPKLRQGSYFPAFLEPRKTVERALVAVIQEAWIKGISTRKIDDLVQAMGMTGGSLLNECRPSPHCPRACGHPMGSSAVGETRLTVERFAGV